MKVTTLPVVAKQAQPKDMQGGSTQSQFKDVMTRRLSEKKTDDVSEKVPPKETNQTEATEETNATNPNLLLQALMSLLQADSVLESGSSQALVTNPTESSTAAIQTLMGQGTTQLAALNVAETSKQVNQAAVSQQELKQSVPIGEPTIIQEVVARAEIKVDKPIVQPTVNEFADKPLNAPTVTQTTDNSTASSKTAQGLSQPVPLQQASQGDTTANAIAKGRANVSENLMRNAQQVEADSTATGGTQSKNLHVDNIDNLDSEKLELSQQTQLTPQSKMEYTQNATVVKISDEATKLDHALATQLTDTITSKYSEGKSEFTMQLFPAHLGKVSIKLIAENGILTVELFADNPRTQSLLMNSSSEIKALVQASAQTTTHVFASAQSEASQQNYTQQENNEKQNQQQNQTTQTNVKSDEDDKVVLDFMSVLQELNVKSRFHQMTI